MSMGFGCAIGMAKYASEFVCASRSLPRALLERSWFCTVFPPVKWPVQLTTIRAMVGIEECVTMTSHGTDTISTLRVTFRDSIIANSDRSDQDYIIRLPVSQASTEKCMFTSTGLTTF
jgi:hypothetical protein